MSFQRHPIVRSAPPVLKILGIILALISGTMLLPICCSAIYGEDDLKPLSTVALTSGLIGLLLMRIFRTNRELGPRGAILVATFGWVIISAVGALPFVLHGSIPKYSDAFFEMMSGFTTTGATILPDIEALPHGLLLWRSESHFLGGMGFITLAVILLPNALSGLRLSRAESSPGQVITRKRFMPRNRDAISVLWGIYLFLNVLCFLLFCLGGMSFFDSLCHTFGTVSTAGYSTYNSSFAHFDSAFIDWVAIVFMFLGGISFVLFFYMFSGNWRPIRENTEFRWYIGFLLFLCLGASAVLWTSSTYGFSDSVRHGTFQVVSILTTSGFTTTDYELWPHAVQMMLYVSCFIGACAGSTTSGIKVVHFVIICKFMASAVKKIFIQPLAVVSVRLNGERVEQMIINLALCYFVVNVFLVLIGGCLISALEGTDISSSMSAVISTLMNVGPGFGDVGPSHTYAHFSDIGKYFLSFNMLVGRLEMFSALVLFYPSFWRR